MFVADRHFFVVDPARPLYRTAVYYVSIMAVNAFVTVLNSAVLILILYSMIGARQNFTPSALQAPCCWWLFLLICQNSKWR